MDRALTLTPAMAPPGKGWSERCAHDAKYCVFDAQTTFFGSKRAEIEGLMLLVS
jgi:hypothetical protein